VLVPLGLLDEAEIDRLESLGLEVVVCHRPIGAPCEVVSMDLPVVEVPRAVSAGLGGGCAESE
jgi:hypothetical protein